MGDVRGRCWHQRAVPARGSRTTPTSTRRSAPRRARAARRVRRPTNPGENDDRGGDCSARRAGGVSHDRRPPAADGVGRGAATATVVVKVDEPGQRVHAIGGNVRGVVSS